MSGVLQTPDIIPEYCHLFPKFQQPLIYLKGFVHGEPSLNAMDRSTLYFRLSVIWLVLLLMASLAIVTSLE